MSVLVSVIIPAKNEAVDLPSALAAVAKQDIDLSTVEIVVVDGDSTDDTALIAKEHLSTMQNLARFEVVGNPGGNTPSNLNRGLEWCLGEFIVRVDARSQIPIDYIRRTVAILQTRPEVAVTGGSQVAVARGSSKTALAIEAALNNPLAMGGSRYRRHGATSGSADTVYLGVFRRSQLAMAGGWNESFSTNQDFELNQRMTGYGMVWFEAGLPVNYLPRQSVVDLILQYHRFGRWKAHYWKHTGQRPNGRQRTILALPLAGLVAIVPAILRSRRPSVLVLAGLGPAIATLKGRAWIINVAIAGSWWTGVLRGLVSGPST